MASLWLWPNHSTPPPGTLGAERKEDRAGAGTENLCPYLSGPPLTAASPSQGGGPPNPTAPPPGQYKSHLWECVEAHAPDCAADPFTGAIFCPQ